MKYTNKHNLPTHLVNVLKQDEYDYNDNVWSATTLNTPSRMFALKQTNKDNLEIDISDLVPTMMGTAIHSFFEKCNLDGFEQEKRLFYEIDGQKISGKFDLLRSIGNDVFRLYDIKTTSVWKWIYNEYDDYIKQLSIYRYLCEKNGYSVESNAVIIFVFTDWSRADSIKDPKYPQLRIMEQNIKLMSVAETEDYIRSRIKSHQQALIDLPLCSKEDLWQDDDKFAVMKNGGVRALRVLETKEQAQDLINNHKEKDSLFIETREGQAKRCDYCNCRAVCSQYQHRIMGGYNT